MAARSIEDAQLDCRGILRGRCTRPDCVCPGYDGGTESREKPTKCVNKDCGHAPGMHKKIDKDKPPLQQAVVCDLLCSSDPFEEEYIELISESEQRSLSS